MLNPTPKPTMSARFYWDRRLSAAMQPTGNAAVTELEAAGFEAFETDEGFVVQCVSETRKAEATEILRKRGFNPRWRKYQEG